MYCVKKITDDLYWLGGSDRRIALFENIYPLTNGVSYNSYLFTDEKTVLLDTVDFAISGRFLENLDYALAGRSLDYVIINHTEPDHCATLELLCKMYPDVKVIGNEKTISMIKQFFNFDIESRAIKVKNNDTFSSGKHNFTFITAPMVHWPEVMVTYDNTDKILFSADAFGTFGSMSGNIFADEVDFEHDYLDEARRYYTNIVGKYGMPVQNLIKKLSQIEVKMICPLHGFIWRENLDWYIEKYNKWSSYTPEINSVMIAYASVYGNTENAVDILASKLADMGVKNIAVYDVSKTDKSVILSESFKYSHLVFASVTYNGGIFPNMEALLLEIAAHILQNRTIAIIENGSWAIDSGRQMRAILQNLKNVTILEDEVKIKSSVKEDTYEQIISLAQKLHETM